MPIVDRWLRRPLPRLSERLRRTGCSPTTQSVTIIEDNRRQVVKVADALEGMLGALGLDTARAMEAQADVRGLREVSAEPSPEPGPIRQLLNKATSSVDRQGPRCGRSGVQTQAQPSSLQRRRSG